MTDETKELIREIRKMGFKPNEKRDYFLVGFVHIGETPLGKFNLSILGYVFLYEQTREEVIAFFRKKKTARGKQK